MPSGLQQAPVGRVKETVRVGMEGTVSCRLANRIPVPGLSLVPAENPAVIRCGVLHPVGDVVCDSAALPVRRLASQLGSDPESLNELSKFPPCDVSPELVATPSWPRRTGSSRSRSFRSGVCQLLGPRVCIDQPKRPSSPRPNLGDSLWTCSAIAGSSRQETEQVETRGDDVGSRREWRKGRTE